MFYFSNNCPLAFEAFVSEIEQVNGTPCPRDGLEITRWEFYVWEILSHEFSWKAVCVRSATPRIVWTWTLIRCSAYWCSSVMPLVECDEKSYTRSKETHLQWETWEQLLYRFQSPLSMVVVEEILNRVIPMMIESHRQSYPTCVTEFLGPRFWLGFEEKHPSFYSEVLLPLSPKLDCESMFGVSGSHFHLVRDFYL
jgi:hypothetical protein